MSQRAVNCTRARELDLAAFALDRGAPEWAEFRAHYPRCGDCSREVARFAELAIALEREAQPLAAHPADAELLAFVESPRKLGDDASQRIARHLATCPACRSEVAVLKRFDLASLAEPDRGVGIRAALAGALRWLRAPLRIPAFALAAGIAAVALFSWLSIDRQNNPSDAARTELVERPQPPPSATDAQPEVRVVTAQGASTALPNEKIEAAQPAPSAVSGTQQIAATAPASSAAGETPQQPEASEPEAPPLVAARVPTEPPRYEPGALRSGPVMRIAGVARGAGGAQGPQTLAPAQLGFSAEPSPTLYWFLPERSERELVVSIVNDASSQPVLELSLAPPHARGVRALSLAEHGVRLAPGTTHEWSVAILVDPARRSRDLVSSAAIRFAPPEPALAARIAAVAEQRAHALAAAGYWYDAFDQLSRWCAAQPESALLRAHRAALLEQVGLAAIEGPPAP